MGLVNWGLFSFTAVLRESGTVTATVKDTHTHTSTHTLEQRSILSVYPNMLVCVDVCTFSLKDDGLVTGHM